MVELSGKGLMSGENSTIRITKTNSGGIIFSNNGEQINALANNVISTSNFVVLGNAKIQFNLIEHLMGALAFCNAENVLIELYGKEIPILDGSAKLWVEKLQKENFETKEKIEETEFKNPIIYEENETSIILIPANNFKITYLVNYAHNDLENKWVTFEYGKNHQEIYEARTFGYLKDLEKFQAMGIALGADLENTIGLKEDNTYTSPLRSPLEPAKHKILDIIGDLHLTGKNPLGFKAHIIAKLAGHKSHIEFAKKIIKEL